MKKIPTIILTAMLVTTSTIPVYATGNYGTYGNTDPTARFVEYANKYKDSILSIEGEAARYDFIFKTVTDDFTNKGPGRQYVSLEDYQSGKAKCSEYSLSVKSMCDIAEIECHLIDGWTGVGDAGIDHVWNLVKIDGKYYYSDAMRSDVGYDYEESKLSPALWSTYTCRNGQLWSADEYLEKDAAEYAAYLAENNPDNWVKSDDIDWSDPTKQYDEVIYIKPEGISE